MLATIAAVALRYELQVLLPDHLRPLKHAALMFRLACRLEHDHVGHALPDWEKSSFQAANGAPDLMPELGVQL